MIAHDFLKCINIKVNVDDGRCVIECKLGLWSVKGSEHIVLQEAMSYWWQYYDDGEYSSILGGDNVIDKFLKRRCIT